VLGGLALHQPAAAGVEDEHVLEHVTQL